MDWSGTSFEEGEGHAEKREQPGTTTLKNAYIEVPQKYDRFGP